MHRFFRLRNSIRPLLVGLAIASAVVGGDTTPPASAASGPPVVFSFNNKTLEMKTHILGKICGEDAAAGSRAYLQEQEGTLRSWRTIASAFSLSGTGCAPINLSTPNVGRLVFRVRYWVSGKLIYISPEQVVMVYGPVSFATLCGAISESVCNLIGGSIQIGGHLETYVAAGGSGLGGGNISFPEGNTCRTLKLTTAYNTENGGEPETPGDQVTITLIQHRLNEQSVNLPYEQVTSSILRLDGGPLEIQFTRAVGDETWYILSGIADCFTATGSRSTPSA
jgi:hypothetical protein